MTSIDTTTEIWKPVVGLEDAYNISNQGRVKNVSTRQKAYTGKILRQKIDKYGYPAVTLRRDRVNYYRTVHRLVTEAFLGPRPKGYQVNHKDGNKLNRCIDNLEYVTVGQNVRHAVRFGLHPQGDRHWTRRGKAKKPPRQIVSRPQRRKFNDEIRAEIRIKYNSDKFTQTQLAMKYKASIATIQRVLSH